MTFKQRGEERSRDTRSVCIGSHRDTRIKHVEDVQKRRV